VFTRVFWIQTIERAIKSAAQGALLAIGASEGFNLFESDLSVTLGFALGAAVLSVLTSLVSAPISQKGTPSIVPESVMNGEPVG